MLQLSKPTPFKRLLAEGTSWKSLISDAYKLFNAYAIQKLGTNAYVLKWGNILVEDPTSYIVPLLIHQINAKSE